MAFQKSPPAFSGGERGQNDLQAFHHLGGHHKRREDHPPEIRLLEVLELNNRFHLRNLNEVPNLNQCFLPCKKVRLSVQGASHPEDIFRRHVGIDHGGLEVPVAEELLEVPSFKLIRFLLANKALKTL